MVESSNQFNVFAGVAKKTGFPGSTLTAAVAASKGYGNFTVSPGGFYGDRTRR
jgi:hypothetical protein